jgi:hypothetical protein
VTTIPPPEPAIALPSCCAWSALCAGLRSTAASRRRRRWAESATRSPTTTPAADLDRKVPGLHLSAGPTATAWRDHHASLRRATKYEFRNKEDSIERLTVEIPKALVAPLDGGGQVSLWWADSYRGGELSEEITVQPCLTYTPAMPITFDDAWGLFIRPVMLLMTLATGEADKIVEIRVSDPMVRIKNGCESLIANGLEMCCRPVRGGGSSGGHSNVVARATAYRPGSIPPAA